MKIIRFIVRFTVSVIIAVGLLCFILWISGNAHLIKAVRSTYLVGETGPTIDDYPKFENRKVATSSPQPWPKSSNYNQISLTNEELENVEKWETTALLLIKNDSLLFEKYWNGYSEESLTNSFSMAKSLTSLAIGAAIKEGKIESVDQKIGDFLPEFREGEKANTTIKDLLTMSSGIDFGESYGDPFGYMAKTYYGSDLYELTANKDILFPAGQLWKYQGGNTLLLSFVLKEATGKNLSTYFSEKFWQPMGATQEALWSLNESEGVEKSYCCFYSNARDFARIGQLMLDSGSWKGNQLISKDYFKKSFEPVNIKGEKGENVQHYGFQWWIGQFENTTFYYARGIQGQYIVLIPDWDMVLVRLGHKRDPQKGAKIPVDLFDYLSIAKRLS